MRILVKVGEEAVIDDTQPTEFTTALEAKEHIEANFSEGLRIAVKVLANDGEEEQIEFALFAEKSSARDHIDELVAGGKTPEGSSVSDAGVTGSI